MKNLTSQEQEELIHTMALDSYLANETGDYFRENLGFTQNETDEWWDTYKNDVNEEQRKLELWLEGKANIVEEHSFPNPDAFTDIREWWF